MAAAVTRMRIVSVLEAVTYLILLSFVANEQLADGSHDPIRIAGPVHGTLFLFYVFLTIDLKSKLKWDGRTTTKVIVASVIPFAPFFVERWLAGQVPAGAEA